MKYSIATVSLAGTLEQKIAAIAKEKYHGIELFENDLITSNLSAIDVRNMLVDHNLELLALQPFRDYEGMPEPKRSKNFDRAERKFDLMEDLGTKKLLICSNVSPLAINDPDIIAEDLFELAERAAKRGFSIGYEALAWGRHVNDYRQTIDIVRKANHANLGVILDSYHILARGLPVDAIRTLSADEITLVQVADAPKLDMGLMHLSRHYRSFPGQGSLPVLDFMKALRSTGYDDYISHEIFSDDFRSASLAKTAKDGYRSLVWLDHLSREVSTEGESVPATNLPITNKQTQGGAQDIAFIEFAADDETEIKLVKLLTDLGFVPQYQHKSKNVTLYSMAKVNIMINRQQNSHANNYFTQRGIGVCALGFYVKSVDEMMSWSKTLDYARFDSNVDAGEMKIPAVCGANDTLYYFIEDSADSANFYEVDFNHTGVNNVEDVITGIDHIGQTLQPEDYNSATLFYRAMLDLNIEEPIDLLDPQGLLYSRVARNKRGSIRIPMNTTHSWGTSSQRFIEMSQGGGFQQIALCSTNIFVSAEKISREYILTMPDNYYLDLRARSDLDEQVIANMQKFNILYDKDENGDFFHFYIRELNGLFFEIIQRNDNYQRYGEVNAQIRLAAQKHSEKL